MPEKRTVLKWLATLPEFVTQYAHAREAQADAYADEIADIADDATNDWMEKFGKDGTAIGYQVDQEAINRSRLRVDARKWIASKLKPKKYGEKISTELTGADGGPIRVIAAPLDDAL